MQFRSRLTVRHKDDIAKLTRGIWSPTLTDWKEIIEDQISISRRRKRHKLSMFRLQLDLFSSLDNQSKNIDQIKGYLDAGKMILDGEYSPTPLSATQREHFEGDIEGLRLCMYALRDIGDGILWRALRFNRPLIHLLSRNQREDTISVNAGLLSQIAEYFKLINNEDVHQVILNETTNFARIGDLISIGIDENVELIEVKGSASVPGRRIKERIERQKRRMEEIVTFTREGIYEDLGRTISLRTTDIDPRHCLPLLREMLCEGRRKGFSGKLLAPHLFAFCVFMKKARKFDDIQPHLDKLFEENVRIWKRRDDLFMQHEIFKRLRFSMHLAPLSVYPLPSSFIAGMLCGHIHLAFWVNYSEIFRQFNRRGWHVTESIFDRKEVKDKNTTNREGADEPKYFCQIRKGGHYACIPPGMMARIAYETLQPDTIIDLFEESQMPETGESEAFVYPGFRKEKKIWK